jgi:uncharacterized protein YyaL (SSP411 family)
MSGSRFAAFLRLFPLAALLLATAFAHQTRANSPANQLRDHPSPYLALHGSDPVAWQEWDADTVARARRENKLLFVSVGYFACHWCHVMQRESFKNPAIAARLNQDFVPVKVDRELHSGLDDALQTFSARLSGIAGWPLNAFVTPDGYPVYVVLYAPPDELGKLLANLAGRWQSDADGIRQLARQAAPKPATKPASAPLGAERAERARQQYLAAAWKEADLLHGGFGEVSKFPMAPQLSALLDRQAQQPEAKLGEFLRLTFDQMAARGLHDHVGGGFFRYTVDPGWDTPHFEKMLYDNAQLALLYLRAADVLRQPGYREVARGTLDFMREALQDRSGGLYASTSAVDEAGREGAYYLWEPAELKTLLTPAAYAAARRVWKLDAARTLADGYLPAEYVTPSGREQALLKQARAVLRDVRKARKLPKDDKMNAGLNGLALSAFSRASGVSPNYRQSADRIQRFLLGRLVKEGRLMKSMAAGRVLEGAELEDYAYVVQGLLDHADATGKQESRAAALGLARTAWQVFASDRGWRHEAVPLLATLQPEAAQADGALYSPSDILMLASLRLQDPELTRRVREASAWVVPQFERDPFTFPSRVRLLQAAS